MHRFASLLIAVLLSPAIAVAADPLKELAEQYKQAGEPVEPVDFEIKGVADNDNAALELRKAANAFSEESDAWKAYDALDEVSPPLRDEQVLLLQKIAVENLKTIEHIDAAMARKGVDWQVKMTLPVIEILLPHLNKQRGLSRMLTADALLMHHQGSHGQALRDVQRMIFLSRAGDQQGFLVGHLVSLAQMGLAIHVVEMITPDLKIGTGSAASEPQVKEVMAQLLDDGPPRAGMRMALLSERMAEYDIASALADGRLTPARLGRLMGSDKPVQIQLTKEEAQANGVIMMRHTTQVLEAALASKNWPTMKASYPKRPKELDAQGREHALVRMMLPALERAILSDFRSATERRLAAVALAIRAYGVANDGKPPRQLSELVPHYLPAVPDDPMSKSLTVRYDALRGIVYSVGEDGKDDGGSEQAVPKAKGSGRWQTADAVLHLQRQPRKHAP